MIKPPPLEDIVRRMLFAEQEVQRLQQQRMEPEMLKILTLLCHPDKHNNSPASIKAIKYLLKLRGKKC